MQHFKCHIFRLINNKFPVYFQKRQKEEEEKRRLEEQRNKEELERFEKKMSGRKKHRERRFRENTEEPSFLSRHWLPISAGVVLVFATVLVLMLK